MCKPEASLNPRQISMNVKIPRLRQDVLKTLNAVICPPTLPANVRRALKGTARSCVQTSMSAQDLAPVESTLSASTTPETSRVPAKKVSMAIHMMGVPTSMSVPILKLVDPAQFVRTSRVVIAATALKVTTEMRDQKDASTTTSALVHPVDATLIVRMKLEHLGASAQKDL